MKLTKKELYEIKAGANISGTLINAFISGFKEFMDVGRYLGSSLRRLFGHNSCSM